MRAAVAMSSLALALWGLVLGVLTGVAIGVHQNSQVLYTCSFEGRQHEWETNLHELRKDDPLLSVNRGDQRFMLQRSEVIECWGIVGTDTR